MMTISLIIMAVIWFVIGIKTWAFVITDLADNDPDRLTVISSFFAGLVWPATYVILSIILIFGVTSQSLEWSFNKIRRAWYNRGS